MFLFFITCKNHTNIKLHKRFRIFYFYVLILRYEKTLKIFGYTE